MRFFTSKPESIPSPADALPGRAEPIVTPGIHTILGTPLDGPWPDGTQTATFGLGCFWGAEKAFWQLPGSSRRPSATPAARTPNPTYNEVCTGRTGHAEVVLVAFDPTRTSLRAAPQDLLGGPRPDPGHAPGQRRRHAVPLDHHVADDEQRAAAEASADAYQDSLAKAGYGTITTEIVEPAGPFYYAEDYHQQYLDKNPRGYCPNHSTGVKLPDDFVGHAAAVRGLIPTRRSSA